MAFYLAFQCVVYQILDAFFTHHQFYLMLIETKTKLNGQSLQFVIFFTHMQQYNIWKVNKIYSLWIFPNGTSYITFEQLFCLSLFHL